MAKRLTKLQLNRIDLVDQGANPGAHITLVKRMIAKLTKTVAGQELSASDFAFVGNPDDIATWKLPVHDAAHARNALARENQTEGIPADKKAAVHAKIVAAATKHGVDVSKADTYTCDECGKTFPTQAALDAHEASAHGESNMDDTKKQIADLTKRAEAAEAELKALKEKDVKPDPLAKMDADSRAVVTKALADAAAANERVSKLEEERDREVYIRKAGAYKLIAKADDFGPVLRKIAKALTPEEFKFLEGRLGAVQEQLKTSKLFTEAGVGGGDAGSAEEKLNTLAVEINKAQPKLTKEQAYAEALKTPEGKALYADHQASMRRSHQGEE